MDDWWVYGVIDNFGLAHDLDLSGLKALLEEEARPDVAGIKKFDPEDVSMIHYRHDGWEITLCDGSVHQVETVLCTEDSVAAFSLE